jgi:hypothetical protein
MPRADPARRSAGRVQRISAAPSLPNTANNHGRGSDNTMINMPVSLRNALFIVSVGAALSACGGGGSSPDDSAPVSSAPPATEPSSPGTSEPEPVSGSDPSEPAPEQSEPEPVVDRTAVLEWDAPNARTDGTCLDDFAAYRVSYGVSPGVYSQTDVIPREELSCVDSGTTDACGVVLTCTHSVENLDTASWYFAIQVVDNAGSVSDYSNEAIKTIE